MNVNVMQLSLWIALTIGTWFGTLPSHGSTVLFSRFCGCHQQSVILRNTDDYPFSRKLCSGDLLFVREQVSDMEKAIAASTGNYTHVALVECDSNGTTWIIESTTKTGVHRLKLSEWDTAGTLQADLYCLTVPFDTAAVIYRAKSFLGQPYDDEFLPDNGKIYCSELICEIFLDIQGNRLFPNRPMNFRDSRGHMPHYWKKHFRKLGMKVPENVLGSNPNDLSMSDKLRHVL